jgi:ubiquinone/menaquinone biosynthesis C-methylase UbiE
MTDIEKKRRKLIPEMEGRQARYYARLRGTESQMAEYRRRAVELTEGLPAGADILEVAPGPGYLAVEIARRGFTVTAVDVSSTFVEIAADYAKAQGVEATFRQGDVSAMPFATESFDRIVSQAAFKNFTEPLKALNEMHRVLRPGGTAVIEDMWGEATGHAIRSEVDRMKLSAVNAFMTRRTLTWLRRRAYSREKFVALAQRSEFGGAVVSTGGIGIEARLTKA